MFEKRSAFRFVGSCFAISVCVNARFLLCELLFFSTFGMCIDCNCCWTMHFCTEHVLMFIMFEIVQRKQIDAIAEYLINIFIFSFVCFSFPILGLLFIICFDSVTICLNHCSFTINFDWYGDFRVFGANKISNPSEYKAWTITRKNLVAICGFFVCFMCMWASVCNLATKFFFLIQIFTLAVSCSVGMLPTIQKERTEKRNHLTLITCYYLLNVWFTIERLLHTFYTHTFFHTVYKKF